MTSRSRSTHVYKDVKSEANETGNRCDEQHSAAIINHNTANTFQRQTSVPNIIRRGGGDSTSVGLSADHLDKHNSAHHRRQYHGSLDLLGDNWVNRAAPLHSDQTDDIPRVFPSVAPEIRSLLQSKQGTSNLSFQDIQTEDGDSFVSCADNSSLDTNYENVNFTLSDDGENGLGNKQNLLDANSLNVVLEQNPKKTRNYADKTLLTQSFYEPYHVENKITKKPLTKNSSAPSMQSKGAMDERKVLSDGVPTVNNSAISVNDVLKNEDITGASERDSFLGHEMTSLKPALASPRSVPSLADESRNDPVLSEVRSSAPTLTQQSEQNDDAITRDEGSSETATPSALSNSLASADSDIDRPSRHSSKKHPKVTFTVTKVEDNISLNSGSSDRIRFDHFKHEISKSPIMTSQSRPHHLTLPAGIGGAIGGASSTDNDSWYGDTLTQTSITKLLSNKFKSYRTYRYNISQNRARQHGPGFRKRLYSKYESQDYDQIENALFLKEQEKEKSMRVRRKWLARWIVSFLIGIGTAIVASVIEVCIEYFAHYKFLALRKLVDDCGKGFCVAIPLVVWILINTTCVFLGSLLVTYGEPQAAGSGIPQIKCYLNGVKIPGLLTIKALVAKAVGVILSVCGGLACGKEGPMIHSGAIVAAGVSQGRSRLFNKDFRVFEYLRSDTERRDFVSGGAAAGVAAAFGAPVGGVLFSLEEGASFWNQSLTWRIVFASMVATFSVNVILSAIHGHPADLSNPGLISFGKFSNIKYQAIEIPIFLLMAVFGGLSGAFYNYINCKLTVFRKKYVVIKWLKVVEAVIVASMSAVMGYALIYAFEECVPSEDQDGHEESNVQLHCTEGEHNVMSHLFFKTPEATLISLLHDGAGYYTMKSLAIFTVFYWMLACWTYGLSVSSGVFIPSLLTGAAWGRLTGMCVFYLFPKMGYDYGELTEALQSNNIGKYALIGAACQLGGTVRMTISLTVILIECTGDITFGLPIVMVLTIAKWTGDFFNLGLYDLHIQMMGIPLLPWEPPEMSYDITAQQVMNKPVVVLRCVEKVKKVIDVLQNTPHLHSGFPVVDEYDFTPIVSPGQTTGSNQTSVDSDLTNITERSESHQTVLNAANGRLQPSNAKANDVEVTYGKCQGLILRSQLILLLKHRVFITNKEIARSHTSLPDLLRLAHFRDAESPPKSLDLELTGLELNSYMDLRPFMNPSPYTVTKMTSLPRMFKLFRGLGLRHLIVVNQDNHVLK